MTENLSQQERWRKLKNQIVAGLIRGGGLSIIFTVVLMFGYLLYKVLPLLLPAKIEATQSINARQLEQVLYAGVNEYADILYQLNPKGQLSYWFKDQASQQQRLLPDRQTIQAYNRLDASQHAYILALSDGSVEHIQHQFEVSYEGLQRRSQPLVKRPWSEPLQLKRQITKIAANESDSLLRVATFSDQGLEFWEFDKTSSLFDDSTSLEAARSMSLPVSHAVDYLFINDDLRWLYVVAAAGQMTAYRLYADDIKDSAVSFQLVDNNESITSAAWLLGRQSLLIGTSAGQIQVWFNVRSEANSALQLPQRIRSIQAFEGEAVTALQTLQQSRVILAASEFGKLVGYFASSGDHLFEIQLPEGVQGMVANPSGQQLFVLDNNQHWQVIGLDDPHPEVSVKQLWQPIHYEGYDRPEFVWQSSASNQDFEPKYSLTPLVFGTLKAAFYAMLFAIPLAIFAAIYAAFFITHRARRVVKPAIEIMEALPTVILGFLAGLWLAPFVENYLLAIGLCFLIVPSGILLFGFFSERLTGRLKEALFLHGVHHRVWILVPVLVLLLWLSFGLAEPIQNRFFDGDFRHYLTWELGITYNQRNALVVGFVMGFAVIPTIFSITEDAIYSVPRHLVNGSLAMGASLWQTLARVVLPTASPGIFSAVMIGFGRAVGETMIVLMATGNTPVMSVNIFEGMRTLAANIAVEMPESAVDSSHFRILFLAALVLFLFTFFFNTLAETVRQRLKKRYSEL